MKTRKGLENTITGMLISEICECNTNPSLAVKISNNILDYLSGEENLVIPHNNEKSEMLFKFIEMLGMDTEVQMNEEMVYKFLSDQTKV